MINGRYLIVGIIFVFPMITFAGGIAERSFSVTCYNSNQALSIFIDVIPDEGTKAWACDDKPPSGWIVGNISDGGVWDSNFRKVKWFFLNDDVPRLLNYDIIPPEKATGTVEFTGRASFDGPTIDTKGESTLDCCPPSITSNPISVFSNTGDTASFSVLATGNGILSYKWTKKGSPISDGVRISGSKTRTITIDPVEIGDAGAYICEVSDVCGLTLSHAAILSVNSLDVAQHSNSLNPNSVESEVGELDTNVSPSIHNLRISPNTQEKEVLQYSLVNRDVSHAIQEPHISIAPSLREDLGYVAVGVSKSISYTVKNSGSGVLTGFVSSSSPVFAVQNPSSYRLEQNEEAIIKVYFKPEQDGFSSCTLTFAGGGDAEVNVTANGFFPHCADSNKDMKISADEITFYASEWKLGSHDCKECVLHGSSIYMKSEKYTIIGVQDRDCRKNCRDSVIRPERE